MAKLANPNISLKFVPRKKMIRHLTNKQPKMAVVKGMDCTFVHKTKYMKNFRTIIMTLTSAILILNVQTVKSQSGVNAYVNVDSVLRSMPGFGDSVKKLENIRIMYQNQYNYLLVGLQQKIKEYETRKDSFSPYIANLKLQEIKRDQANLDTFQAVANNSLDQQRSQIYSGFFKEIKEAAATIGAQKKYSTIWDSGMLKNAIWTDPKTDITTDVINAIKNKATKTPVPPKGKSK